MTTPKISWQQECNFKKFARGKLKASEGFLGQCSEYHEVASYISEKLKGRNNYFTPQHVPDFMHDNLNHELVAEVELDKVSCMKMHLIGHSNRVHSEQDSTDSSATPSFEGRSKKGEKRDMQ